MSNSPSNGYENHHRPSAVKALIGWRTALSPPESVGSGASALAHKHDLKNLIAGLKSSTRSPLPVLQNWLDQGNKLSPSELRHISRNLLKSKRYHHALEVRFSCPVSTILANCASKLLIAANSAATPQLFHRALSRPSRPLRCPESRVTVGGVSRAKRHQMDTIGDVNACKKCLSELLKEVTEKKIADIDVHRAALQQDNNEEEEEQAILSIGSRKRTAMSSSDTPTTVFKAKKGKSGKGLMDSLIFRRSEEALK
ncbi:PPR containing plant-like protein [Sesbania bispinosa]|nr:PPR containing plant-like protein [Sesbania bispinosa]